jgi:hypothetical protein
MDSIDTLEPFQCFARLLPFRQSPSLREDITGLRRPSGSRTEDGHGIDPPSFGDFSARNSVRSVTAARCVASICGMYFPASSLTRRIARRRLEKAFIEGRSERRIKSSRLPWGCNLAGAI